MGAKAKQKKKTFHVSSTAFTSLPMASECSFLKYQWKISQMSSEEEIGGGEGLVQDNSFALYNLMFSHFQIVTNTRNAVVHTPGQITGSVILWSTKNTKPFSKCVDSISMEREMKMFSNLYTLKPVSVLLEMGFRVLFHFILFIPYDSIFRHHKCHFI